MKESFLDCLCTNLRAGTAIMAVNTDEETRCINEIRRAAWKSCNGLQVHLEDTEVIVFNDISKKYGKEYIELVDLKTSLIRYDADMLATLLKEIGQDIIDGKKVDPKWQDLIEEVLNRGCAVVTYDLVSGFSTDESCKHALDDALASVIGFDAFPENCIFVFKDCHEHLNSSETINHRRTVRNIFEGGELTSLIPGKEMRRHIVFVQPDWTIHRDLQGAVCLLDFQLPTEDDLDKEISIAEASVDVKSKKCPEQLRPEVCLALRGFTQMEAANALGYCLAKHGAFVPEMTRTIHRLQKAAFAKNSVLDLVDDDDIASTDQVGGFEHAIEFAEECKICWTAEARKVGLRRAKGCLLLGVPGTGKAQPLYSKVLTTSGWKQMGDIGIGDSVVGCDGLPTRVTGVYPQGNKQIYRVRFEDDTAVDCCEEHLWFTQTVAERRAGRSGQVRTTKEIAQSLVTEKTRYNHRVPVVAPVQFRLQEKLSLPPYLLGVLLGNGGMSNNHISLSCTDAETLMKVKTLLPNACKLKAKGKDWYVTGTGYNKPHPVKEALIGLGLMGKKSVDKFIPGCYLVTGVLERLELLQGLMDTDGTCDSNGHHIYFCTSSVQLANDVVELVRSLGGITRITKRQQPKYQYNGETRIGKPAFRVNLKLPENMKPFSLSRKADLVKQRMRKVDGRKIVSVENTGMMAPMCCISVAAQDHLYITDNYTVTHNTLFGKVLARIMGLPLIVYDIAAQFGSLVGQTEATTKLALAQIKAKGPCVVLIDEADKLFAGIVSGPAGDSGVAQRMLSRLLTFMATDNEECFLVLTMNRTLGIPPEMLRAGRLDALFYTTFPTERERREILGIHLKKNGANLDVMPTANIDDLVKATDQYVGAELEQICIKSVRTAFVKRKSLTPNINELLEAKRLVTPVAKLDEESIRHMDNFCKSTAKPVSKEEAASKVWSAKPTRRQIRTAPSDN